MSNIWSTLVVFGLLTVVYEVTSADSFGETNEQRAIGRPTAIKGADTAITERLGDSGVGTLRRLTRDLDAAAGEHGKYMLVKKKPKHKKIKMEVYEPKMKYKKIKMKIPVKKMKKKKVKGYLVKKEHGHEM